MTNRILRGSAPLILLATILIGLASSVLAQDEVDDGTLGDVNGDGINDLYVENGDCVELFYSRKIIVTKQVFNPDTGEYEDVEEEVIIYENQGSVCVNVSENFSDVGDYDNDGQQESTTFNSSDGSFTVDNWGGDSSGSVSYNVGTPGSIPVIGSYSTTGCTDLGSYNQYTSTYTTLSCGTLNLSNVNLNYPGALPVPADYDGDGLMDYAVFDRLTNTWSITSSLTGQVSQFVSGTLGSIPVPGDYLGLGYAQLATYSPTTNLYHVVNQFNNQTIQQAIGQIGDLPYLSYFNNNFGLDFGIFNTQTLMRYVFTEFGITQLSPSIFSLLPLNGTATTPLKLSPLARRPIDAVVTKVPNDFDGDRRTDIPLAASNGESVTVLLSKSGTEEVSVGRGASVLAADYSGKGAEIAVINALGNGSLEWQLRGGEEIFGKIGDQLLAGDLDGDRKFDKVAVRKNGNSLQWFSKLSSILNFPSRTLGAPGDTPFVADINGDSRADYVVAARASSAVVWTAINPDTGATLLTESFGDSTDKLIEPADINGDGAADLITVSELNGSTIFKVKYFRGGTETLSIPVTGGQPLTGFFSGVNRAEFAVVKAGVVTIRRFDGVQIVKQSGIANATVLGSAVGKAKADRLGCIKYLKAADGVGKTEWKVKRGAVSFFVPAAAVPNSVGTADFVDGKSKATRMKGRGLSKGRLLFSGKLPKALLKAARRSVVARIGTDLGFVCVKYADAAKNKS